MRGAWWLLSGVSLSLISVIGCKHTPELKPPPQPEVLSAPDAKDRRFDMPCKYPPETLKDDYFEPKAKKDGMPMGGPGGKVGMGGMPGG